MATERLESGNDLIIYATLSGTESVKLMRPKWGVPVGAGTTGHQRQFCVNVIACSQNEYKCL